jgi:phospholipid/cholesterol/gamma-HCH transport system substrate-binding protein
MPRHHRWKELTIGIFAGCAVLAAALAILVFGRPGRLHGKTTTLFVTTDAARGLIPGSEVWLDGQKVGVVKSVTFRPPSVSPRERLVITMEVIDNARPLLRVDSRVQIRAGGNIIGDQVVYLSSGTAKMRGVVAGDTIRGGQQSDTEEITSDMALASREFPGIIDNVKLLAAQLQTAQGTLGAFGIDGGGREVARLTERTAHLLREMGTSTGTLGRVMSERGDFQLRAARTLAQVDSIRTLLASGKQTLGRFRRDSSLIGELGRVRAELAGIQSLANSPAGTIGRLRTDSVLVRNIHRDAAALDSLVADMKKHPLRYIAF